MSTKKQIVDKKDDIQEVTPEVVTKNKLVKSEDYAMTPFFEDNQAFNLKDMNLDNPDLYVFDESELDFIESPDNYKFIESSPEKPLNIKGLFAGIQEKVNSNGKIYNLVYFYNPNENPKFSFCFGSRNIIEFLKVNNIKKFTPMQIRFLRKRSFKTGDGTRFVNEYEFLLSKKHLNQ